MLVFQLSQDVDFLKQLVPLLHVHLIDFSHQNTCILVGALLAFPERVVVLHDDDHLLRHDSDFILFNNKASSFIK
jgi:hypothetical protein